MPVIFHFLNGHNIIVRGERVVWWRRVLMALGFAVRFRDYDEPDLHYVSGKAVALTRGLTEEAAARRRAEGQARAEAEAKKNPNPGRKPRVWTPGR